MKFNDIVQEIAFKSPVKIKDSTNLLHAFDEANDDLEKSFNSNNRSSQQTSKRSQQLSKSEMKKPSGLKDLKIAEMYENKLTLSNSVNRQKHNPELKPYLRRY